MTLTSRRIHVVIKMVNLGITPRKGVELTYHSVKIVSAVITTKIKLSLRSSTKRPLLVSTPTPTK